MKIEEAQLREKEEIMRIMHPLVKEWFFSRFESFSIPQLYGVLPIHERKNILISAPTGGTKTLTAFLSIINYLVGLAEKNELEDKIYATYVSPLKALSNDIYANLKEPLEEIESLANKRGIKLQKIRIGLRTGDTSASERQRMLKNAPHILVTTPETLSIVLNSKKFVEKLSAVEFIIVDELHALANKRGVHLSISLEWLQYISKIHPVRIGLSATISPLEEMAKFLVGSSQNCLIADAKFDKKIDLEVLSPVESLIDTTGSEMHTSLYNLIDNLIQEHKTTLIFTNTRSATERVIHHLKERFPDRYIENIGAHHSSLSKEKRFEIERKLREGKLKVVVTSTSLELGIDIGYIDLVIMLGSPKSVARAMQRIGRAGHKLHETAKGRFIVLDKDDLVECSIMKKEILERKIDKIHIPTNCLDVLSQQIYGLAIYKVWDVDELFDLIRSSYCYRNLSKEDFLSVISYLSGEYSLEAKQVYGKVWYDDGTRQIGKKGKLARIIYLTNIGTIPDESYVSVVVSSGERKGQKVGVIDEAFAERLKPRDVFVLGGEKYEFLYTRGMKAYVRGSVQRPPTIPSWFSEMLPLSFDLALEISRFRELMKEKFERGKSPEEIKEFIQEFCRASESASEEIYDYFLNQHRIAGIPSLREIIVENYRGEKKWFVFHTLYGRRVNDAFSRAIAFLASRIGSRDIEISINDNGFALSGENLDRQKVEKALKFLDARSLEKVLKEAIDKTEILKRRFRHCAARSLMILRSYKGQTKSAGRQQVKAGFILDAVKRISEEFPILKEARREILEDMMDIENTKKIIGLIRDGKIRIRFSASEIPSPFSLNLIMQGRMDLMRMEDKIEFLKRIYKQIKGK